VVTTISTASSSTQSSMLLNPVQLSRSTLARIASKAATNGAPAFWSPSASSGKEPVANRHTSSQAGNAMAGSSQAKSARPGHWRCLTSDTHRTAAMASTATMTVSLVSTPQASSRPASTGRRRRTASRPASRKAQATGSAVSLDTLVSSPKYMGTSSPHSAWCPPSRANIPPRKPMATIAATLTATSMNGTRPPCPRDASQTSAG
jgi:hypothetical protein